MAVWRDVENPFTPGWGDEPPRFSGRGELVHEVLLGLQRGPGPNFHRVLTGGRGTGKTVLLNHLEQHIRDEWGWPVIQWAGDPDWRLRQLLAEAGPTVERDLTSRARRTLRPDSLTASVPGVGSATKNLPPAADPLSPTGWLQRLGELAASRGKSVVLVVDEVQAVHPTDIASLSGALQIVAKRNLLPVALVAAGLPNTRQVLRSAPGSPFLERQQAIELTNLTPAATREALEVPILDPGREITADALDHLATFSDGYPYAVQVIGEAAWDLAGDADTIAIDHATEAGDVMFSTLEEQLYISRWEELTDREQQYVIVAARLLTPRGASTPAVAVEMGGSTSSLSRLRDGLIKQRHIVHDRGRGYIDFTIPGFANWVRKTYDDARTHGPGGGSAWRTQLETRDLDRASRLPHHPFGGHER